MKTFESRSDDIYIASYPRSGTTLVQMMVYNTIYRGHAAPFEHLSDVSPFLDLALTEKVDLRQLKSPRILKTHLPHRLVSNWPGKHIYVLRDGRDVAISYYHFCKAYFKYEESFSAFFRAFLTGEVPYGSWFRHVASYWSARATNPRLFLLYERLTADFDSTLMQIERFLGLSLTLDERSRIANQCSFQAMKNEESKFAPRGTDAGTTGAFIRKGHGGSWMQYFTPIQHEAFDHYEVEYLGHTYSALSDALRGSA